MNQEIQTYLRGLQTDDWENAMHSLIDMGERTVPDIMDAWLVESDPVIRERLLETMSEMPTKEVIPFFEIKLFNGVEAEVRFAACALVKFDAFRYESEVIRVVRSHLVISQEKEFIDYIEDAIKLWKSR